MKPNFFMLEPPLFVAAYLSFNYVENYMKVIVFFATVGYTLRRWYLMEKSNRKQ